MDMNIEYAGSFRRGLANVIDIFNVLFLRILTMQFLGFIWLRASLERLNVDFKQYYGTDIIDSQEQVKFIIEHSVFKEILLFLFLVLLAGACYHAYLNSSSWSATIGKRIMGIMILDKDFKQISFQKGLCHYFLSIVPMVVILYLMFFQSYHNLSFLQSITANSTNIFLSFVAISWVNIHIFTNRKNTAYDMICKTVMIEAKSQTKFPWRKNV